jgi:hypothetical protein
VERGYHSKEQQHVSLIIKSLVGSQQIIERNDPVATKIKNPSRTIKLTLTAVLTGAKAETGWHKAEAIRAN